jgi:hypothetical protein
VAAGWEGRSRYSRFDCCCRGCRPRVVRISHLGNARCNAARRHPIGFFIYGYFLLALRRFLLLSWPLALALLGGFIAVSFALASYVPREVLNGSCGYLPALAALIVFGRLLGGHSAGSAMLVAAGLFVVSLIFRIIDLDVCARFPIGTHFLWHVLNAAVLYTVLRGAIAERQHPLSQERK